jgi:hypothetical protein
LRRDRGRDPTNPRCKNKGPVSAEATKAPRHLGELVRSLTAPKKGHSIKREQQRTTRAEEADWRLPRRCRAALENG